MKTQAGSTFCALALAGLATMSAPAFAAAPANLPSEQFQGPVGYVTGGVGVNEAKRFEGSLNRYPLAIELLEHAGPREEFTADAMVRILDRHDHAVLEARAGGPFMLVDLPPGRYSVSATLDGRTLRKADVRVARGATARATFEFAQGTDERKRIHVAAAAMQDARDVDAGMGG